MPAASDGLITPVTLNSQLVKCGVVHSCLSCKGLWEDEYPTIFAVCWSICLLAKLTSWGILYIGKWGSNAGHSLSFAYQMRLPRKSLQWGFIEEEIGRSWDIYPSKTKMADFLKITLIGFYWYIYHTDSAACVEIRGQLVGIWSLPTEWVLELELRPSDLASSGFTQCELSCQAIQFSWVPWCPGDPLLLPRAES